MLMKLSSKIKRFSHLKCALFIFLGSIIILVLSLVINEKTVDSVLQNIFAGLITGLVITLIGGIKSKEIQDIEIKKDFYEELDMLYSSEKDFYWKYVDCKKFNGEEYNTSVKNLVEAMESIDTYILQMDQEKVMKEVLGEKPSEYFRLYGKYDIKALKTRYDQLRILLAPDVTIDDAKKEEIDSIIRVIQTSHLVTKSMAFANIPGLNRDQREIERTCL